MIRFVTQQLEPQATAPSLTTIATRFLVLGTIGFGGGLAVIAQLRQLVVERWHWITEGEFAEGFAIAQSLPGANAGNLVTYVGLRLRGLGGAAVALASFIAPSAVFMIILGRFYADFRDAPQIHFFFRGLIAAVVALILITGYRIGSHTMKNWVDVAIAVAAFFASTIGRLSTIEIVFAAGAVGIIESLFRAEPVDETARLTEIDDRSRKQRTSGELPAGGETAAKRSPIVLVAAATAGGLNLALLATLALTFLRIGAATFGGGFVMIPEIQVEVVDKLHWIDPRAFADAAALGQITPGPVLIMATFIGYRVAGVAGAIVATIAIFLPAFILTVIIGSSFARFRAARAVQDLLSGVVPAVVGLVFSAAWGIARVDIHSWVGAALAIIAVAAFARFRVNSVWILFACGLLRVAIAGLTG